MAADRPNIDDIFLTALEKSPHQERAAYLDEVCGEDAELRARVERLLGAQPNVADFLERPAVARADAPTLHLPISEMPGAQIGPYKLLQEIGEGGMGVVYMAEQHAPVKRRVALKLVKPGMDTRQVIARFEAERQALAMMDHPNIAKVLDCGTTDSGHPYFVMELVKGIPVTRYCDVNHLTPRERLELFMPICQAIQHAHQKGIIHRDIKPSNILVAEYDQKPVPKIIDFGVAKALNTQLTEKTMFTQLGQVVGTLEYMSPEQSRFNQLDVDTRSDIYSLGVLLYELLAGATPFDRQRLKSAAFDEMLRIIREEEPPRPSTRLSTIDSLPSIAANRHTEPKKLAALLRGELDWIVMKAMEKDRARRYETVSGLASDVQRFLQDEAVVACPPSAGYRFKKFARRNKVALATGGLVAATLVVGIVATSWQAYRATRAEGKANARLVAETKARREANEASQKEHRQRLQAEQARKEAEEARTRAEKESARANNVVSILKSLFSSNDPSEPGFRGGDVTLREFVQDLSDQLPETIKAEPEVEAEVRSIILRAAAGTHGGFEEGLGRGWENLSRARELRETVYPSDHPAHIESLMDLIDFLYLNFAKYEVFEEAAKEVLERAQSLPDSDPLKLRAYVKWLQVQPVVKPAVRSISDAALRLAQSRDDYHAVSKIVRLQATDRFMDLLRGDLDSSSLAAEIPQVESLIEQGIAAAAKLSRATLESSQLHELMAQVKRFQSNDALAEQHAERAQAIRIQWQHNSGYRQTTPSNGEDSGLPEVKRADRAQRLLSEGFRFLNVGALEGYRVTVKELLELYAQNPSIRGTPDGELLFWLAGLHPQAVDDWPTLATLAREWLEMPKRIDSVWVLAETGGILFRAGNANEALSLLNRAESLFEAYERRCPQLQFTYWRATRWYTWTYTALAQHALGDRAGAIQKYSRAALDSPRGLLLGELNCAGNEIVRHVQLEAERKLQIQPDELIGDDRDPMLYVAQAVLLKNRGELEQAILKIGKAIELEPSRAEFWVVRGDWWVERGQVDNAILDYSQALNRQHDLPSTWIKRGDCYTAQRSYDSALKDFRQALQVARGANDVSWTLQCRAKAFFELGRFPEALRDMERGLNVHPGNVWVLGHLGYNRVASCPDADFRQAYRKLLDRAIKISGANQPTAYYLRALFGRELGDSEAALADFNAALQIDPYFTQGIVEIAETYRRLGDYEQAIRFADRAIANNPADASGYIKKGECYGYLGQHESALAVFTEGLKRAETATHKSWALQARARAWFDLGNYSDAIRDIGQALDWHPDQVWAVSHVGLDRAALCADAGFRKAFLALANRAVEVSGQNRASAYGHRGVFKRVLGEAESAADDFRAAIDLDPALVFPAIELAELYRVQGKYEAALELVDKAIQLEPQNGLHRHRHGDIRNNMGKYIEAIHDYSQAIALDPTNIWSWINRADCHRALAQFQQAIDDYRESLKRDHPEPTRIYGSLLECFRGMNPATNGLTELRALVEQVAGDEPCDASFANDYSELGELLRVAGQREDALHLLNTAIQLDPQNWLHYHRRGDIHNNMGKYIEAIHDYSQAIALDPTNIWSWINRADCHRALAQFQQAIDDYRESLKRDHPEPTRIYGSLLQCYRGMNPATIGLAELRALVEQVAGDEPRDASFANDFSELGELLRAAGQREDALHLLNTAIQLDPQNWLHYHRRGETHHNLGQQPQAIEDYSKAIELDPSNAWPWNNRADCRKAVRQFEQAIGDYRQAIQRGFADLPRIYGNLAACLRETGRSEEELGALSASIELQPENPEILLRRAILLRELGRLDESLEDFAASLRLEPNNTTAYFERSQLYVHRLRNFDAAIADASKYIELAPTSHHAWGHRGNIHNIAGNFPAAIADYDKALELAPGDTNIFFARASARVRVGQAQPAVDELTEYLTSNPRHAGALHARGQALCQLQQFSQALDDFRAAEQLEPRNRRHTWARLGVQTASGEAASSAAELEQFLQKSSDPGRMLVNYGMELIYAGLLEPMEAAALRSAEYGENTESIMHYNLGCGFALAGHKDRAFSALRRTIELGEPRQDLFTTDADLSSLRTDPRFVELLEQLKWRDRFNAGRAKYEAGQFAEAIAEFSKAIEHNPNLATLWHWRGTAHRANGQVAEADADFNQYLAAYEQAVANRPEDWVAIYRRGLARSNHRHWDTAQADFSRAIELAPGKAILHRNRATSLLELQRWSEAADDLDRVIELGGADWQTLYHLALACLGADDHPRYRATCRQFVSSLADTTDPQIANFAAWTCCLAPGALDDWKQALTLARRAVEARPESLQYRNTLGMLLLRAGQAAEAIEILTGIADLLAKPEQSAKDSPTYTWYGLALALHTAGKVDAARSWYSKAQASATQMLDEAAAAEAPPVAWNRRLTLELLRGEASSKFVESK